MDISVKPIPEGLHTVTPCLCAGNASKAIEFYKNAFGALEKECVLGPEGKIVHAELKIGDSVIFVRDECPHNQDVLSPQSLKGTTAELYLYFKNVDAIFDQAVKAGGKVNMPLADMFWGDRYGQITDPYGHVWGLATRKENVAREELEKRMEEHFAATAGKK